MAVHRGRTSGRAGPNVNSPLLKVTTVYSQRRLEKTATSIATLGRGELKKQIKNFRGRFKLDFSEDYLNTASVDRLRHILLAALITGKSRH